jgi:hypothetical protein
MFWRVPETRVFCSCSGERPVGSRLASEIERFWKPYEQGLMPTMQSDWATEDC